MYEHHFGITGLPFQLSPDPYFYFDSPQHHAAMAMVRHAFDHAPPILVLSGEVGAGKTTILSAWALELEAAGVAVGQLVTTQLDAADLTRAVATAFGLAEPAALRIGDDPGWQWLLDSLHGRRALLIIDEAQNLADDALLRVVQLAGIVLRRATPMRICLAGQPELRTRIDDPLFQGTQEVAAQGRA